MDRLYSIQSPNGVGYSQKDYLELDKRTPDYYQYYIKNEDEDYQWHSYIFETNPGICCNCNKDMKTKLPDEHYKGLYPGESLFIFKSKRGDEYWNIYYHYCTDCMEKGLYNWSKTNNRKYPILRCDGGEFVNMLRKMDKTNIPKNIKIPRIYRCDYYLSNGYRYLDEDTKVYTTHEMEMKDKLENMDNNDIVL